MQGSPVLQLLLLLLLLLMGAFWCLTGLISRPVLHNDLVRAEGRLVDKGRSSMNVFVEVFRQDVGSGKVKGSFPFIVDCVSSLQGKSTFFFALIVLASFFMLPRLTA